MSTHRNQQLDINLGNIQDSSVREALNSIVGFVNNMTQSIRTSGTVKGKTVAVSGGTAGLQKDGGVFGKYLELNDGGPFKVNIVKGSLSASDSEDIDLETGQIVLGVFGWVEISGGPDWCELSLAANSIYVDFTSGALTNRVRIINGDAGNTNQYRLIIFYSDR